MLSYKTIIAIEALRQLRKDDGGGLYITQIKQAVGLGSRNRHVTETVQALKRARWVDTDSKNRLRLTVAANGATLYDLAVITDGELRLDARIGLEHWSRWAQGNMQQAIHTEERLKRELSGMMKMMNLRDVVSKGTAGPRPSPPKEEF